MRRRGTARRAHGLLVAALLCTLLPATAHAAQSVRLYATLTPERLGHGTTIGFGFQITTPAGRVPPPLTQVEVLYPGTSGSASVTSASPPARHAHSKRSGQKAAPPTRAWATATALAEIPIGPEIVHETAHVMLVLRPPHDGHLALLFYAAGEVPVWAPVTLPGLLLPAPAPYGGRIDINVPLIPGLPAGPDVALVQLRSTIGPRAPHLLRTPPRPPEGYHPKGILLPENCPHGGFPFAVTLTFLDGSHASAHTTVPCPAKRKGNTDARLRKSASRNPMSGIRTLAQAAVLAAGCQPRPSLRILPSCSSPGTTL